MSPFERNSDDFLRLLSAPLAISNSSKNTSPLIEDELDGSLLHQIILLALPSPLQFNNSVSLESRNDICKRALRLLLAIIVVHAPTNSLHANFALSLLLEYIPMLLEQENFIDFATLHLLLALTVNLSIDLKKAPAFFQTALSAIHSACDTAAPHAFIALTEACHAILDYFCKHGLGSIQIGCADATQFDRNIVDRLKLDEINKSLQLAVHQRLCNLTPQLQFYKKCNKNQEIQASLESSPAPVEPAAFPIDDAGHNESFAVSFSLTQCSYSSTGSKMARQHVYRCYTCKLTGDKGCCSACARLCHKAHDVSYFNAVDFYCDCGIGMAQKKCSCLAAARSSDSLDKISIITSSNPSSSSLSSSASSFSDEALAVWEHLLGSEAALPQALFASIITKVLRRISCGLVKNVSATPGSSVSMQISQDPLASSHCLQATLPTSVSAFLLNTIVESNPCFTGRRQNMQLSHVTGKQFIPSITAVSAAALIPGSNLLAYIEGNIVRLVNLNDLPVSLATLEESSSPSISLSESQILSKITLSFAPIGLHACSSNLLVLYSIRDCCFVYFDTMSPYAASVVNFSVPLEAVSALDQSGNQLSNSIVSVQWLNIDNLLAVVTQRFVCLFNASIGSVSPCCSLICQLPNEQFSDDFYIIAGTLIPSQSVLYQQKQDKRAFGTLVCLLSNSALIHYPLTPSILTASVLKDSPPVVSMTLLAEEKIHLVTKYVYLL